MDHFQSTLQELIACQRTYALRGAAAEGGAEPNM
jgi:hypothetical protein